ncbi:MAG: hypothetical protein JWN80_1545 [Microbacteriaceae bacterium]|nr:hypothetical protein [Microbacteriaceae bacterium]
MSLDPSPHAPSDFDFMFGDWTVRHQRLRSILSGSDEWYEFDGLSSTSSILGGYGNLEDNLLNQPDGQFRAVALRSYTAVADGGTGADGGQWSIWWLDGRNPTSLDTPVRGAFRDGIGTFFAEDVLNGRPIRVRFVWDSTLDEPTWEQAFSSDDGERWETNWKMQFTAA